MQFEWNWLICNSIVAMRQVLILFELRRAWESSPADLLLLFTFCWCSKQLSFKNSFWNPFKLTDNLWNYFQILIHTPFVLNSFLQSAMTLKYSFFKYSAVTTRIHLAWPYSDRGFLASIHRPRRWRAGWILRKWTLKQSRTRRPPPTLEASWQCRTANYF